MSGFNIQLIEILTQIMSQQDGFMLDIRYPFRCRVDENNESKIIQNYSIYKSDPQNAYYHMYLLSLQEQQNFKFTFVGKREC